MRRLDRDAGFGAAGARLAQASRAEARGAAGVDARRADDRRPHEWPGLRLSSLELGSPRVASASWRSQTLAPGGPPSALAHVRDVRSVTRLALGLPGHPSRHSPVGLARGSQLK